jgi:hypothetical protein
VQNLIDPGPLWRPIISARVVSWLPVTSAETGGKDFTGYIVSVAINRTTLAWRVTKRYSEFVQLNRTIHSLLPRAADTMLCKFPDDSRFAVFSKVTDSIRNERSKNLSSWLQETCLSARFCAHGKVFDELSKFLEAGSYLESLSVEQLVTAASSDSFGGTHVSCCSY